MFKMSRTFVVLLIIILVIAGYFFAYRPFSDYLKVQKIRSIDAWVESYYSANDRYPTTQEFATQFPSLNVNDFSYYDGGSTSPSGFVLGYDLSAQRSFAYGYNSPRLFDNGYYQVEECDRWKDLGFKAHPGPFVYMMPMSLEAEFDAGTVNAFANNSVGKALLTGLLHPRLVGYGDDRQVYVLSGKDVYLYQVQFTPSMQLVSPKKIGTTLSACPAGYSDTGKTN